MSGKYTDEIEKYAKDVWQVMHSGAHARGMALIRDPKYGDGRVIINTVGAFIKGLSKERDWNLDQTKVDLVRRYLKASGNVVVLSKVEQYKFRIFIRETWHDGVLVVEPITKDNPSRADKISAHDAGEDREAAPVEFKCGVCGSAWRSQNALNSHKQVHKKERTKTPESEAVEHLFDGRMVPLSEHQAMILGLLKRCNGTLTDSKGRVASKMAGILDLNVTSVSSTARTLNESGYVTRKIKAKRTYEITLTKDGVWAADNLNVLRASRHIMQEFMETVGRFEKGDNNTLYETIAEATGISEHRAMAGLLALESDGVVDIIRPRTKHSESGVPVAVILKGHPLPLPEDPVLGLSGEDHELLGTEGQDHESYSVETAREDAEVPMKAGWLSDEALLILLKERLAKPKVNDQLAKQLENVEMKIEMIETLVEEVNAGRSTPLKALGEIEEALNL